MDGVLPVESSVFQLPIHAAPFPLKLGEPPSHCHSKVENRIMVQVAPWPRAALWDQRNHRSTWPGRSLNSRPDCVTKLPVSAPHAMSLRVAARSGRLFKPPQTLLYARVFTNVVRGVHSSPPSQGVHFQLTCVSFNPEPPCSFRITVFRTHLTQPDSHKICGNDR